MKRLFYLTLIAVAFTFTGCDVEGTIYDGAQTLAYFNGSSATMEVELGGTNTTDVEIGVSTLSSVDRTLTLSVGSASTATAGMYSFPTSVTIPANEYFTTFTVTGVDDGLTTAGATLIISIDGIDGGGAGVSRDFTLTLIEVCPVPSTMFVGDYLLEQLSPYTDGPTLSDGSVVTLTESGGLARSFDTENFPLYCSGTFAEFTFTLVCNETVVPSQDNLCNCGDGSDWFGAPRDGVNGTYDVTDDSVFTIRFVDDSKNNCGLGTAETEYRLTKQ